ncbi:MAG: shikimate kinase AroK [Gammaproteobacteria bacterium]|nr:MAG: shikimate kinase AroK [Gammaproteobacteria bacterium]
MLEKRNVILVGPMGAGKSTIGRQLAAILNYQFYDSDHEIEARTGADIPWIFDVEGEAGFRKREASMIDELTQLDGVVLATGGGAVTQEQNRKNLAARGVVVYLKASVEQQLERTARDRNRPLLQTDEPRKVLTELMAVRGPIYDELADVVVDTGGGGVRDVAQHIADLVLEKF